MEKNIQPLGQTLPKLKQLQGVYYDWRRSEFPSLNFSKDRQIGLIAQEVEKLYPELVKINNKGYKSLDYMSLTAVLLEGIKEQQNQLDEKEQQIEQLKKELLFLKKTTNLMDQRLKIIENSLNMTVENK